MTETNQIFNENYTERYEAVSAKSRTYEIAARALAKRLTDTNENLKNILEVGSGTGNSTTVFLECIPNLDRIYAVEPSNFIETAIDKQRGDFSFRLTPKNKTALDYMKEMSLRMQPYKDKMVLIKGDGNNLPIKEESVDAVVMNQVFHWLSPELALPEFRRILRPGGLVAFDESGSHFDFGQTAEGQKINDMHITKHPFFANFHEEVSKMIKEEGILVPDQEQSSYMFSEEKLETIFNANGFNLVYNSKGESFTTTIIQYNITNVQDATKKGARMEIARKIPEAFKKLEGANKIDRIIFQAMEKTKEIWQKNESKDVKSAGTLATFVFEKQ